MINSICERLFKLKYNSTNSKTEIIAGVTTFMTMAYILSLAPILMSKTGMNANAVFTATAIASAIGCFLMSFLANLPIGLAPGVGATAFFAFTIVISMGYSWQFALTAVFIEGILFIILTLSNIRELIINCFPKSLQHAITCGIGLFITFIGLMNSGLVVVGKGTPVTLGNFRDPKVFLAAIGIIIIGILLQKQVKASLLLGIIITAVIGIPLGVTKIPSSHLISMPSSLFPIFFHFKWQNVFSFPMLVTVIILLYMELFDTVGTLLGIGTRAKLLDSNGNVKNVKQALMADAIATTCGSILGTATVTAYVESISGVAQGGKTGMTSFTIGVLFVVSLFVSSIFLAIPTVAVSPVLVVVGLFMIAPIREIDLGNFSESLPAFLIIIMMPFSYNIADGIALGTIVYVAIKLALGKIRELNKMILILAVLFLLKLIFI